MTDVTVAVSAPAENRCTTEQRDETLHGSHCGHCLRVGMLCCWCGAQPTPENIGTPDNRPTCPSRALADTLAGILSP